MKTVVMEVTFVVRFLTINTRFFSKSHIFSVTLWWTASGAPFSNLFPSSSGLWGDFLRRFLLYDRWVSVEVLFLFPTAYSSLFNFCFYSQFSDQNSLANWLFRRKGHQKRFPVDVSWKEIGKQGICSFILSITIVPQSSMAPRDAWYVSSLLCYFSETFCRVGGLTNGVFNCKRFRLYRFNRLLGSRFLVFQFVATYYVWLLFWAFRGLRSF